MIISFADKPQVVQEFTVESSPAPRTARLDSTDRAWHRSRAGARVGQRPGESRQGRRRPGERRVGVDRNAPATAYIFSDGRFEDVTGDRARKSQTRIRARRLVRRSESGHHRPSRRDGTTSTRTAAGVCAGGEFHECTADSCRGTRTRWPVSRRDRDRSSGRRNQGGDLPACRRRGRRIVGAAEVQTRRRNTRFAPCRTTSATPRSTTRARAACSSSRRATWRSRWRSAPRGPSDWRRSISCRPTTLESAEYRREAENGTYDLIIYDQCAPQQMPRANTLFIGRLPPEPAWRRSEDASGASRCDRGTQRIEPVDWSADHRLGPGESAVGERGPGRRGDRR